MLCIFTFMQKCKEIINVHQKCGKHHILANSVMAPYVFNYANRNKAEPRDVTKQVVRIILRNRIFHGTIRHIRSGFPSYAQTLCSVTLPAYALKTNKLINRWCLVPSRQSGIRSEKEEKKKKLFKLRFWYAPCNGL